MEKNEMIIKLTDHFNISEFYCKDGTKYPKEWISSRLIPLCNELEKIRSLTGQSMHIVSGYRTKEHNDYIYKLQGLNPTNSMHIQGIAVDILLGGMTVLDLYKAIEYLIKNKTVKNGGLGIYYTHVHYDIRQNPARWNHTKWNLK